MHTRHPSSPSSDAETWLTAESADPEGEPNSESADAASQETDDALIGTTLLDAYKVVRVMGEGGMGRIYEAHHTRLTERRFAIKVLRPELVTSPLIRARFQREVEAVSRVTHPGVLTVFDVGTTPHGWPFMVSEHLSGLDLLAYLRRFGALPSDRAVHMGCRIAEALEATHAAGVIHRDIKPSNIFLLGAFEPLGPEWDRVKIIDFGLSRVVSRDDQLTKTGIVMGTPAYMSPEQASGERTDHLTDVYGVGAVLYAAATGVPPFREETPQQTVLAVLSREAVRPRDVNPALAEGLEAVIQRAMSKQPADRHPSMSALRLDLSNLELRVGARASGARTSRSLAPALPGSAVSVRMRVVGLVGAALLLCLGALASAALGLVSLIGPGFELSTTERALLALALGAAAGLLLVGLRRFERRTWSNTARLIDTLPRLRAPLVTALVVYALGSFLVRFGDEVVVLLSWDSPLGRPPRVAWPGWSALLSTLALFAAAGVAAHQSWWRPMRPLWRAVWAFALCGSVALATFAVAHWGSWGSWGSTWATGAGSVGDSALGAAVPSVSVEEEALPGGSVPDAGDRSADAAVPSAIADSGALAAAPPAALVPEAVQPSEAQLEPLAPPAPPALASHDDPESLKAAALAHARRPGQMLDAVRLVAQLLAASPEQASDPELRQILSRAASGEGEASRAAFAVMSEGMGSHGPDLLYDLMLQKPALYERAKFRLSRFRVRKLFSPELAVAFDLRFTTSCGSRLGLLPRANELGDQRSINVLSSLANKSRNCGRRDTAPCYVLCPRESEQFNRSIETIARRIRGGPKEEPPAPLARQAPTG